MNNAQPIPRSPARRWHNHVPAWISEGDHFRRLSHTARAVLQGIANACPPPSPDGSLVGAFGGRGLIEAIGCSASTFWVHVARLERAGLLVILTRGGLALSDDGQRRNLGNVYGIPGVAGALDARSCDRELCRMVRTAGGQLRRQITRPGAQATLWIEGTALDGPFPAFSPRLSDDPGSVGVVGGAGAATPHRGRIDAASRAQTKTDTAQGSGGAGAALARPGTASGGTPGIGVGVLRGSEWGYSGDRTPSTIVTNGFKKTTVEPRCGESRRRPKLRHIERADLTDTRRLLGLYADAVDRGLVDGSDAGRLAFVAMAERAVRVSGDPRACRRRSIDPCAVMASNINEARWLLPTAKDEDRANARIKAFLYTD